MELRAMCRNCVLIGLCGMALGTWLQVPLNAGQAQRTQAASSAERDGLKGFLQRYVKARHLDDDKTTRYLSAFFDLNGDGRLEAIVYLVGRGWCGSGGCPTLILARDGTSYKLVTSIFITRAPIRVFNEVTNGWRNIGVWVQGGGILPGHEMELRFDGRTYPSNPTMPPATRVRRRASGDVVIAKSEEMTPLYP